MARMCAADFPLSNEIRMRGMDRLLFAVCEKCAAVRPRPAAAMLLGGCRRECGPRFEVCTATKTALVHRAALGRRHASLITVVLAPSRMPWNVTAPQWQEPICVAIVMMASVDPPCLEPLHAPRWLGRQTRGAF